MIIWCFALKISFSHDNCTQGFIALNFLFAPTAVNLRNSQIYENYQLWCSLDYSNFFQVFVRIFEKPEKHIIRKIFYEVHGSSCICRVGKMFLQNAFIFFSNKSTSLTSVSSNQLLWKSAFYYSFYLCLYILYHNLYIYVYWALVYHYCVSYILQRNKTCN